MSRTYRKSKWHDNRVRDVYIENELKKDYRRLIYRGWDFVRKDKAVYLAEYKAAQEEHKIVMEEYNATKKNWELRNPNLAGTKITRWGNYQIDYYNYFYPMPYRKHVSKTERVPFTMTYDEYVAENYEKEAKYFDKSFRDGYGSESGRCQGFRKECAKTIRISNRSNYKKIMKMVDYEDDDTIWVGEKEGKAFKWNWF